MERSRRRQLRELNGRAWNGDREIISLSESLDSSLKKNTAFIKRLRTGITSSTSPSFSQEIRTLSLHKYLSEITAACYEGVCRLRSPSDLSAGVEVISLLHQRFGPDDFSSYLGWYIGRGLAPPDQSHLRNLSAEVKEKEERERLSRQRSLLKVVTELWLVGVLRSLDDVKRPDETKLRASEDGTGRSGDGTTHTKGLANGSRVGNDPDAAPFPLEVLKEILGQGREHVNLPLVILFAKSYAWDVLGLKPSSAEDRKTVDETGTTVPDTEDRRVEVEGDADDQPLTKPDLQQRFRNVLIRYFENVKDHLVREQKALTAQARRNAEAYVKSGEIFEDRQANHEKRVKAHEKLIAEAQALSQILGLDMPDLRDDDEKAAVMNGSVGLVNTSDYLRGQGDGAGIWEDEEERRFYENLVDLKERVPGILLEDKKKKKKGSDDDGGGKEIPLSGGESENERSEEETTTTTDETKKTEDQSMLIANKTVGAKVDALLARLPNLVSKDQVDEVAIEFCFLNSKASRNRLIKAVQEVPKGRTDLLPFYARLIATLGRYLTDVVQRMVTYLDSEFRSLQRRKDKDFLGHVRTRNVRYLAELIKFGLVPEHVVFHCLKVSLDDFSRVNIEIMCHLLESCGRYLLRNPETSPRMQSFMETLQRKKTAQHLPQQERMLIENAIYYVDPPERAAIIQRERTPVELYVRNLIYLEMNKRNFSKVLKQLRKLHWEEQEVVDILVRIFTKPSKVKYGNIHLLAVLVGALYRYHQDFVVGVIDDLLENVTLGLEQNEFKYNQRRISEMKYLGELYNYKMVDSPVIFDTLYRVVTFGHEGGTPRPDRYCELDPPDDFFRTRLVCALLETCGMCFDRGTARKKLDFFLTFFQYYIHTKVPLPMEIEFLLQDTFALIRPQWQMPANLEDAREKFAEAVTQNYKGQENDPVAEQDEMPGEISSDGELDDDNRLPELDEIPSSSEDNEVSVPPETSGVESEEERIIVTRQEEERDPEADAEFDRELAKLTAESLDSRKFDRKPLFDVPLPIRRTERPKSIDSESGGIDTNSAAAGGSRDTMAFSLLTRRGNRQQTRTVEMPADSTFAVALKSKQEAEREEQKRIKDLVLEYDMRRSP
ncbi:MAG: hypothetical protein M1823_004488 [Watsoniomyces obsoletus]|nr:MAG: hypothetical protein M1823_004488 [Watsoniomyces obsoletus]